MKLGKILTEYLKFLDNSTEIVTVSGLLAFCLVACYQPSYFYLALQCGKEILGWRFSWSWQGFNLVELYSHQPAVELCGTKHCTAGNMNPWLGNVRAIDNKFSSRMNLYLAWYVLCSKISLTQALLKLPRIITDLPPKFTVGVRQFCL